VNETVHLVVLEDCDAVFPHSEEGRQPLRCHFLALFTSALIEREIRTAMAAAGTSQIPLYPELRACTAPSAARILDLFSDLTPHQLRRDSQIVQTFHPELSPPQEQVLKLLQIPTTTYTPRPKRS